MVLLGKSIDDKEVLFEILKISERFVSEISKHIKSTICLDLNYSESIPDTEYYLIYNRYITIGKNKVDKRVVRKVSKQIIISELNENWFPGLEPNFILIPVDLNLNFGIYIQDSIYLLKYEIL